MSPTSLETTSATDLAATLRHRITGIVAVEDEVVDVLLVAMLAGGHALIEGIPGIGKTLLARTMARCVDCEFRRIQFTNDLMPSDIVGTAVWHQSRESFSFAKGPLFSNIVLADEINRTSPRTLSCLLEAMENGIVSVEGRSMALGSPFLVWATRNPIEFHGTYPIPEAALDRFLVRVELGYPDSTMELALYQGRSPEDEVEHVLPLITRDQILALTEQVKGVCVAPPVADYCYRMVAATRNHDAVALGASPRAALAWLRAARARALLQDRNAVLPDDLIAMAVPVLAHRMFLHGSGTAEDVVRQILSETPVAL